MILVVVSTALAPPGRVPRLAAVQESGAPAAVSTTATPISSEWELDCFSRPVMVDGKKLWELMVIDSTGQWREVVQLPATKINSVTVQEAVDAVIRSAPVKPTAIRFFRRQMVNMLTIALNKVAASRPNLRVIPSRSTHALYAWLDQREAEYSLMDGFSPALVQPLDAGLIPSAGTAGRLPEALRGEKYAFVTLPLSEVLPGGSISSENVGAGKLLDAAPIAAKIDAPIEDLVLHGLLLLTRRPDPLAMAMASLELAAARADTSSRQLVLDVNLDETYLLARLTDDQRAEAALFERGKADLSGLHFLAVQDSADDDADPAAFWLLREFA
ncbi:hypothetical protein CTAYLR_003678 [Chrysophaeum taylorii]|uniref:Uncharacterized protein n=1 Tax=Chrysophaeum taylorii TaxID=2483200 RepID=A0AAD7XI02_9STRA|nr:hypothetical protein CTAYLR_003678 [Chrysophaeum taylorii]